MSSPSTTGNAPDAAVCHCGPVPDGSLLPRERGIMTGAVGVDVREASRADVELLVQLRLEYIRADLADLDERGEAAIAAQLRTWIPANLGQRFFAEVAFVDGRAAAVAMLAVNEFPANPGFPNGLVGTVLNVWTRPPYRRRGLATAVMRHLIRTGAQLGLSRLELRSSVAAQRLYESLGFGPTPAGHLPMELRYCVPPPGPRG